MQIKKAANLRDFGIRKEWEAVLKTYRREDPFFIPPLLDPEKKRKNISKVFFIISNSKGDSIGRATITIDNFHNQMKNAKIGFIDDLLVLGDYLDCSNELIKACLEEIKNKGMNSALVRNCYLPISRTTDFKCPAYSLPNNPKSTLGAYKSYGFEEKEKHQSYLIGLSKDLKNEKNNRINISEVTTQDYLPYLNMINEVSYPDICFIPIDVAVFGKKKNPVMEKLRTKEYIIKNEAKNTIGFFRFSADLNLIYSHFLKPSFGTQIKGIKKAVIGGFGLRKEYRGKGIAKGIANELTSLLQKAKFSEFETGPILLKNASLNHIVKSIITNNVLISTQEYSTLVKKL